MKIKLKNYEVFALAKNLKDLGALTLNKRLAYAVSKNGDAVSREVHHISQQRNLPKAIQDQLGGRIAEYQRARSKIAQSCAVKDEKGTPIMKEAGNFILGDSGRYEVEIVALDEAYKDVSDVVRKNDFEYEEYLRQDVELDLHAIDFQLLPDEISPSAIGLISALFINVEDSPKE